MANRLKKLAAVQYVAGSPYVPRRPAYCTTRVTTEAQPTVNLDFRIVVTIDPMSGRSFTTLVDRTTSSGSYSLVTRTSQTCYPAVPAVPGVPGTATYKSINGWNGGGRSIAPLTGDGAFRFTVSSLPAATVVGLVRTDASTLPIEQTHGFYVHGTTVDIIESGVVVATAPSAHDPDEPLSISRTGASISYLYDGWTYTSETLAAGDHYLDVSIYASGDYVDDPELLAVTVGSGEIRATLPRLFAFLSDDATPEYSVALADLPLLYGSATGLGGAVGSIDADLPLLVGVAADHNYGEVRASLSLPGAEGYGGFPEVSLVIAVGAVPPPAGFSLGLTGEVGSAAGVLPALVGMASDHAYAEVRGTLPALTGFGLTTPDVGYGVARSPLVLGNLVFGFSAPMATISSGLELSSSVTLSRDVSGSISSTLTLGSEVLGLRDRSGSITSALLLGGTVGEAVNDAQYAVNLANGALTTYAGFDFVAFARAGQTAYGARSDGVYRLRAGDDNGQSIDAFVDFGETEFDIPNGKTVESVFLGLATDGDATVALRSDGTERSYVAIPRGPLYRASAARGVTARRWNLTLDVAGATELELDNMEQVVAVATRRWTR